MSHARRTPIAEASQALSFAARATSALSTAGIVDPDELPTLADCARKAEFYHAALSRFRRAKGQHQRFAATHDDDDPAHGSHQDALSRALNTLRGAEQAFVKSMVAWREARGESADTTFAGESRELAEIEGAGRGVRS